MFKLHRATILLLGVRVTCFAGGAVADAQYAEVNGTARGTSSPGIASDQQTTRIVSLVPNLTELAFTIGAGEQVVGVSDFCSYPPEARNRPAVGGLVNPSLEGVLRLRPNVVLLYRSQRDFANRLASLGVNTELFQVDTLADLSAAIDRMGTVTGETTAAAALAHQIHSDLNKIATEAKSASGGSVSGLVIVSRDPAGLRALYQATFLGQIFEIAGGKLAIPGAAAISTEDIIRANPRLIIDFSSSEAGASSGIDSTTPAPQKYLGQWATLPTVPAVRNGDVYHWSNPHALLLGASVVDTARQFQQLIKEAAAPQQ